MLSHLINNLLRGFICPKTCGNIKNHKKHNLPSPGGIGQFIHEKHNWGDACSMVRLEGHVARHPGNYQFLLSK